MFPSLLIEIVVCVCVWLVFLLFTIQFNVCKVQSIKIQWHTSMRIVVDFTSFYVEIQLNSLDVDAINFTNQRHLMNALIILFKNLFEKKKGKIWKFTFWILVWLHLNNVFVQKFNFYHWIHGIFFSFILLLWFNR